MTPKDSLPAIDRSTPSHPLLTISGSRVVVDASPLALEAECSLQQGLQAMATRAKTYALVYQNQELAGVLTYENVTQAAIHGADFEHSPLGEWMTSVALLTPTSELSVEDGPKSLESGISTDLPLVSATGLWLGLLTPTGVYTLPPNATSIQSCTASLNTCQRSSALLKAHHDRLFLVLKAAQIGTLDWNLATNSLFLSEELQELLGFTPLEFDGSYDSFFKHIHPEDHATVRQALEQAVRHRHPFKVDFRVVQQNGSVRWLLSQGRGVDDPPGTHRLVGVTLDISAHKRAEDQLKLQAQRERLVGEIAQRIGALLDLDSVLKQTVISVQEFIEADRVIILQRTVDMSGEVIQEACAPAYPAMMGWTLRDPWSVDEKFLAHYRQGRGLAVANIYDHGLAEDQLAFLEYFQIQAEVVVPLLQEENLWGLLIAHQCSGPRQWGTAEVRLLQSLATQVGIAIQQAKLHRQLTQANQELKRMAYLDGLTKVANRRRFEQHLDSEWRRMTRLERPIAVILADIDYFKDFNDLYGHQAGDNCLRLIARTLSRAAKRPGDLVARYGGEEFVVILPNTDLKGAETVAEEIRCAVRDRRISHKHSAIDTIVTMSLGVASCIPSSATTSAALLKRADEALYAAKHGGRDQVRSAPEQDVSEGGMAERE